MMMLYCYLQLEDAGSILKTITLNETFQSKYVDICLYRTLIGSLVIKKKLLRLHSVNKTRTFVCKNFKYNSLIPKKGSIDSANM